MTFFLRCTTEDVQPFTVDQKSSVSELLSEGGFFLDKKMMFLVSGEPEKEPVLYDVRAEQAFRDS
jgi:hypothetical protein